MKVLVTGSKGQLGRTIKSLEQEYPSIDFLFTDSKELNIAQKNSVTGYFDTNEFDFCINCAAYTNVEQAEKTPKKAFSVNAQGVGFLAKACKDFNVTLVHISTDYVFDGKKNTPYTIHDSPNPINEYGKSKLQGELNIQQTLNNYHIVRTSWLYSEFGNNFYKTIVKKAKTERVLYVTDQQMGCPTNAKNLAIHIIEKLILQASEFGIHHYTDGEAMTWYDFAKRILKENKMNKGIELKKANDFSTFVKRPVYSVLK